MRRRMHYPDDRRSCSASGGAVMSPSMWSRAVGLFGAVLVLGGFVPAWGDQKEEKDKAPKKETKDAFTNSVGMKLVRVKAGKFTMGAPEQEMRDVMKAWNDDAKEVPDWLKAEGPQHEVEISKDFLMG